MPYVSRELLRWSIDQLNNQYSPLVVVSIPCMLAAGVPICDAPADAEKRAMRFGASDERDWLDRYFRVRGESSKKPYYMPGTGALVEERYPDRALQRRRKDFDG